MPLMTQANAPTVLKASGMYRTTSEGGASAASSTSKHWWRLPRKKHYSKHLDKNRHPFVRSASGGEASSIDSQLRPSDSTSLYELRESNYRQLQSLIQRIKAAPSGPSHVDSAYKELEKIRETCSSLCHGLLQDHAKPGRSVSNATEATNPRSPSIDSPRSPGGSGFDQRSSFSGRSTSDVVNGSVSRLGPATELYLNAIRDWKTCLQTLCEAFKVSLADTYKSYERDATPEMIDLLFASKKFRREAVHRMRNASVTRVLSADPQFFPRYEIRFRNYERVRKEVGEIRQLLQLGESGISPLREVQEFAIAPRGDAVLEFANLGSETSHVDPVLRFRVSSYMLAETSPIFARMFSGHAGSLYLHEDEDITPRLPPPPTPYMCRDGSEVKLYRMPQYEVNRLQSLEILMHAAHMHRGLVPREVSFEQFVAIAECSMRYRSTSPLELVVEHMWLPQWMHRGAEDMPDGLLVISYAFGSRELFTRTSKSAILHLADERELQAKPWPQRIKDKIWAVRCAKLDQIHSCCTNAIQEYIRPPVRDSPTSNYVESHASSGLTATGSARATALTGSPRCPRGSHSCDAVNLGWMMLMFNEMGVLPQITQPCILSHMPKHEAPALSLAQRVDMLRTMPSPASPVHRGGVCDPSIAFRTAVADIYSSVTGLTLHDVSGKSHGWALSKHRTTEPQTIPATGLDRMAASQDNYTVAAEFPGSVRLRILAEIDRLDDLQAAAQVDRGFYETYKTHEVRLMRNILRADHRFGAGFLAAAAHRAGNTEDKILKQESDLIRQQGPLEAADSMTLFSTTTTTGVSDDEDDLDGIGELDPAPPPGHAPGSSSGEAAAAAAAAAAPATGRAACGTAPASRMTEEEAQRILWPEPIASEVAARGAAAPPSVEGSREKFRMGAASSAGLEAKTLVVTGHKQLRSELDRRMGLLKKDECRDGCRAGGSKG
ncbi:uncharacterized protein UV8b_01837 [Ustilaginoidea virens]|uniref:BTB domain-containing protein n=1 Tax=Ustilaginoidea virens TaxID=1159556 RepID=A0A1B5L552_USTVR|nr:uncharacterized protein UV8b_01837 [Ustilaginoidea virens]QUC17596.1 hypothetical protein UV8b_01837 [Ustilaginoidea virens]GAO18670.1 hypothetical protein UVI_02059080 [Ustilaginoidea virens]